MTCSGFEMVAPGVYKFAYYYKPRRTRRTKATPDYPAPAIPTALRYPTASRAQSVTLPSSSAPAFAVARRR